MGTAFAISIGALTGITQQDAGVASGLLNTSQNLGGAIGVAVASSLAASRFHALVHHGSTTPVALTGGFQLALWVSGLTGLLAIPVAFGVIRRHQKAPAVAVVAHPVDRPGCQDQGITPCVVAGSDGSTLR